MSDELQKKLDMALARIAALESEKSTANAARAPQTPALDPRQMAIDPIGTMTRAGVPVDHITRVLVAHAMGDQAPPELRVLAQMGPQVSATQALSSDIGQLRQRLDAYETRDKQQAVRQSFSALAVDKTKYPTLAAAYARDPKLFDSDMEAHRGDAAALADSLEARLKALASAVTPTASTADAAKQDQSKSPAGEQVKQAQGVDNTPPPLPTGNKSGSFTQEDHQALKERIIKKYSQPQQ